MAELFWQLEHAAFDFIPFPVTKVVVSGGMRSHTHEYPKSPGGAPEKLGRKLYTIKMSAVFDAFFLPPWTDDLWPGALSDLFDRFEEGITSTLMIPTVGPIKAFCTNWTKEMEVKARRSGETAELEFLEDQSGAYLFEGVINVRVGTLVEKTRALAATAATSKKPGLFAGVLAALRKVQQMIDREEMISNYYAAQVEQLDAAFSAIVGDDLFDSPEHAEMLNEILAAWEAARLLLEDLLMRQVNTVIPYITPRAMTVGDVSCDVYGDTSQASVIMQMNALPDPLLIPTATELRVYQNRV